MGSSADARLAWGVALLQPTEFMGDKYDEPFDLDAFEEEHSYGWLNELDVPLEIEFDGTSDTYGENTPFLILTRNSWAYDYGHLVVEPETLREPTEAELTAIQKVLDHIGFKGNRDVKLYLIASYG